MESQSDQSPLIVIVGETASGKSSLALKLARHFDGEIIAADSRTVYKGLDIGTAKPSPNEQRLVPHHAIDVITPDQTFTASDFKQIAAQAIATICKKGRTPFLVGGTGLYIDAVLYDFSFRGGKPDQEQRERLQKLSVEALQQQLIERNIKLPENQRNPRHLMRQLETGGQAVQARPLRKKTLVLGLRHDRSEVTQRIRARVGHMFEQGLEQEVRQLIAVYGQKCAVLQTIGYQEFEPYFEGKASLVEVRAAIERHTLQYAKRQRTWFKRNKSIHWLETEKEAVDLITTFLNK